MATELSEQSCKPLKGAEHLLSTELCAHHLERLAGWQLAEHG